jgi:iron complex outermembrane recepter protein
VAPSVEWSASDIWVDYANTTRSPSYAIVSVNAGWDITPDVTVFVDARNLGDEAYVSNVQAATLANAATAAYWPGDGRAIFGGLTWKF